MTPSLPKLLLILVLSISVLSFACQEPGTEFPDIEATVLSQVAATVTAIHIQTPTVEPQQRPTMTPTSTPIPTVIPILPTPPPIPKIGISDWMSVVSKAIVAVVAINTPAGTGSGFFFEDGLVMTNAHVVGEYHKATVVGEFGGVKVGLTGDVLAVDEDFDIAVISVGKNPNRPVLRFGRSELMELAEDVVVIGFPLSSILGESISVSKGVVSSKRNFKGVDIIQTDAATNPGNSGGPLINSSGNVIGMVSLKIINPQTNSFFEGTGIAISSDTITKRLPFLLNE